VVRQLRIAAEKLPPTWGERLQPAYRLLRTFELRKARRQFESSEGLPAFLPEEELETLACNYLPPPDYGYDPTAVGSRGNKRAAQILALPGMSESKSFLELGCWDGMVCAALQQTGKVTTGVDARSTGFDQRARDAGVHLGCMDAEALEFPPDNFDVAFSYNAFEHFRHPDRVLTEMLRVVKPGGLIWLEFGPLYLSPYGEHVYRNIPVPYCSLLWPEDVLNNYTSRHGLPAIDYSHVNRWRLEQFRALLRSVPMEPIRYYEGLNLDHLNLISRYSSCFKAKTEHFEDLLVQTIRALFRIAS